MLCPSFDSLVVALPNKCQYLYLPTACQRCPATSTCDDVIGCDACSPGKKQPDCVEDCEHGYYGVNCKEICGYCKDQSKCAITNGYCPNGCETWYTSDICTTYIASPEFASSIKPVVVDVTNSSITVTWPTAMNILPGLEAHYYYLLWLQADGAREKNVTRVEQGAGEQRMEARITGLAFNKKYSLRVEPYREHNGEREGGASTATVEFTTSGYVGNIVAPTTPLQSTNGAPGCSACFGFGALVGTAVASLLLGMGILAVIMLSIQRIRQNKNNTDNQLQGTEMSPTQKGDEEYEDPQGYVIPPRRSQEEEGDYYNTTGETTQSDGPNVYDVIQT
ncbi:hypothetical protein NP493_405g04038 [Ridgeia piscesae]|uniref:Fibronectin type-III domain-containing protein n=1 Tax=Ridgeia piscesae TaxID=27915 RepID=A0AAD9L0T2_RIDPI|nr:hypothetical protein NP493_405g04038 [Ridgeia piscesae]